MGGEHGNSVPNANDTSTVCAQKLTKLAALSMPHQAVGLYGNREGASLTSGPKQDYSLETAAQAVAVFSASPPTKPHKARSLRGLTEYSSTCTARRSCGRPGPWIDSCYAEFRYDSVLFARSLAVLTRQEHWYFVLPESNIPPSLAALVLTDFGPSPL
jgi:hypothetical protein